MLGLPVGARAREVDWRTLLEELAGLPYAGEAVDQLAHARQCPGHAVEAGADDELVVASLFHDVGRARPVSANRKSRFLLTESRAEDVLRW